MNVGFVGLGKLGLPCCLAIEKFGGHRVWGTDKNPAVLENVRARHIPYREEGAQELLDASEITIADIPVLVAACDIVFVAVQTPHEARFEGVTPLPPDRADFDYSFLVEAVREVAEQAMEQKKSIVLAVISTVLPGTVAREVRPHLNEFTHLCYNPFFIAMGTTIHDFMNPEFVLMGTDDSETAETMKEFYGTLHNARVFETSVESAELTKVAYNTFIGIKIVFANTLMEICEATGANVDHVTDALSLATNRLISPKYLRAGMGDGGGCHPRDNIAMSWLAREINLSYDFFDSLMQARESQTRWLAQKALDASRQSGLPIIVMGKAFKPETNLIVGSPALLLVEFLEGHGVQVVNFDPRIDRHENAPAQPAVYVIATRHDEFAKWPYPQGSVIIDPWGYIADLPDCTVHRIGRGRSVG